MCPKCYLLSSSQPNNLIHLPDELVDVGFPVTKVTTQDIVLELPCPPAASGIGELERPQEVGSLLEVGPGGDNFVNKIFNAEDVVFAESVLDDAIVGEGDALLVDLAVSALVDQLTDGLQVRFTIGDVRLNKAKHLLSGASSLDEDTIVDLEQAEKLQDLAGFGSNLVDTPNADNEVHLGLSRDVKVASRAGSALEADLLLLLVQVLLDIGLGALEDDLSLSFGSLENMSVTGIETN
jgi:hypothetical protein